MFWILRTDALWRALPPCYGKWGTVYQRFRRWRDKGMWEKRLETLTEESIAYATIAGMEVVISFKRNRKQQRARDRYLYRLRHLVENAFLHFMRWRGIATRHAKNTASFLVSVQSRCIAIW